MEALKYTCCLDKFGQVFLEEKNCEKGLKTVESLLAIVIFSTNNYDFERDSN